VRFNVPLLPIVAEIRWRPLGPPRISLRGLMLTVGVMALFFSLCAFVESAQYAAIAVGMCWGHFYLETTPMSSHRFRAVFLFFVVLARSGPTFANPKRIARRLCSAGESVRAGLGSSQPSPPVSLATRTNSLIL
jgi:hypothetical protein